MTGDPHSGADMFLLSVPELQDNWKARHMRGAEQGRGISNRNKGCRSYREGIVGARLLDHLISTAPGHGYWKLVGMILPQNTAGLALAARHGFSVVGTHRGHGRIAGEWRDVTLVERHLHLPG